MSGIKGKENIRLDFTTGPILPMLFRFMLPILLANLLNSLYNTVDTIIIGQYGGSAGIIAVNTGGKMLHLLTNVAVSLGGGGQIVLSQLAGARKEDEISPTIGTLLTEMFVLSAALGIIMVFVSDPLLTVLNTPQEAFPQALSYLRIVMAGLPFLFGYTAVSSALRGMGDSRHPLIFIAIAASVNIVGDLIFIIVFDLGATGAALATIVGQAVSTIFSLAFLYRNRARIGFEFRRKSFRVDPGKLKLMLRLGIPVSLRYCFITLTQLILLRYINLCGIQAAAAYAIGDKIYHLVNNFTNSIKQAGGAMVGQNIGADRQDRVKEIVKSSFVVCFIIAGLVSLPCFLIPEFIFGLFTSEEGVLAYAKIFMLITSLIFFLNAWLGPYEAVFTGTGNARLSFFSGVLDGVVFRIGFTLLYVACLHLDIVGFYLADATARIGVILVGALYYHTGAWLKHKKLVGDG